MLRSQYICYLLCVLMLNACAGIVQMKDKAHADFFRKSSAALGFMNSFSTIKYDFERGRIMKARSRVLAMEKANKDYAMAHELLKEKIEPARRRLFIHYLRKARSAETQKLWSLAMSYYKQAKEITIKPELMEDKRLEMEYKLRQLRLNILLTQRRKEDYILLINPNAYEPPKGAGLKDEVFYRKREQYEDELDDRAARAYREAKRYLRRGMPEISYIDIESFLHLQPDSDRGKKLMKQVKAAIPKQLIIPPVDAISRMLAEEKIVKKSVEKKKVEKKKTVIKRVAVKKDIIKPHVSVGQQQPKRVIVPGFVSAEHVQALILQDDLLRAKKYAQAYRREGGKGAVQLLNGIQKDIERKAADLFAKGGAAFRQEHLDQAIGFWSGAVVLMPEEDEYVEALRRARQLEERLTLLRQANNEEPVPLEE